MACGSPSPCSWPFGRSPWYPNQYVWLVFFSALDVILTGLMLAMGGSEVNPVALQVIDHWGLPGAMAFKFALTLLAIVMCELVGRRDDVTGRKWGINYFNRGTFKSQVNARSAF